MAWSWLTLRPWRSNALNATVFFRFLTTLLMLGIVVCLSTCSEHSRPVRNAAAPESLQVPAASQWPSDLPVYDHVVIVVEENKGYAEIIGSPNAPYINGVLVKEGATLTRMFAEEHHSEGNYFWLFSGSNHNVGFRDKIPSSAIHAENLGHELIEAKKSFAGFSEGLSQAGSTVEFDQNQYARKHVPWISFDNVPASSNLRFPRDFPKDFNDLPTVSFVIPNLIHNMHSASIRAGDDWLRDHLDGYYRWAKEHNSILIVTFDEDSYWNRILQGRATDPKSPSVRLQNRIPTILAGARIRPGFYDEANGANHVTLLRTLEAMYHLKRAGKQQEAAEAAGINDDAVIMDVFERSTR
jgi:hypothetical protein